MMSLHSEIKIQEQSKQFEHPCSQKGPFQFTQGTAELYSELKKCAEWSPLQNARYAAFLELNGSAMEHQPHKKLWGLYEQMAKVVRSRNFRQCKSHHQKMLQAHKAIPGIVSHLLKSVPKFQQLLAGEKDNLAGVQAQKEDKEQLQPTDGSYYPEQPDRIESERSLGGFLKFPHAYPMGLPASKSREEEWRECHQLFIEWTSRLKHLMRNNAFP